jgi:MraZ protein
MLLTGTFHRAVDEKQRIAIPKKTRQALVPEGSSQTILYIAPGTDGSLAIYNESAFEQLGKRLSDGSPTGQNVRAFSRLFYARAQSVEMDAQGRIRIPQELAELVKLGREAVLIGVRDHLELWDRANWNRYMQEKQSRYDELAEQAFHVDAH